MSETRGESYPCEPTFEVPVPGLVASVLRTAGWSPFASWT